MGTVIYIYRQIHSSYPCSWVPYFLPYFRNDPINLCNIPISVSFGSVSLSMDSLLTGGAFGVISTVGSSGDGAMSEKGKSSDARCGERSPSPPTTAGLGETKVVDEAFAFLVDSGGGVVGEVTTAHGYTDIYTAASHGHGDAEYVGVDSGIWWGPKPASEPPKHSSGVPQPFLRSPQPFLQKWVCGASRLAALVDAQEYTPPLHCVLLMICLGAGVVSAAQIHVFGTFLPPADSACC
jgi:hypothetical protein